MKYVLIYGANETTRFLLEAARVAALHASRYGDAVLVADRYGIESEAMKTCRENLAPLLVVGTTARPTSSISARFYERVQADADRRDFDLRRHIMQKAFRVVVIGDSPDCKAMMVYAQTMKKPVAHYATGLRPHEPKPIGPDHVWYSNLAHEYTDEACKAWTASH